MSKKIISLTYLKKISPKLYRVAYLYRINLKYINLLFYPKENSIIVRWDGHELRCGFADRLKGIISAYELSKITNRTFKMLFNEPVKLERYLIPKFNWLVAPSDLEWNFYTTKFIWNFNRKHQWKQDLDIVKKRGMFNKKIFWYHNVNILPFVYNTTQQEIEDLWRKNFWELFEFSDEVIIFSKLSFEKQCNCVFHLRFAGILGDFDDEIKTRLNDEEIILIMNQCLNFIMNYAVQNSITEFAIVTDSINFIAFVKDIINSERLKYFKIYLNNKITQNLVHFQKTNEQNVLETFADFYYMSQAKHVIGVGNSNMYKGVFAYYAAVIGGAEYEYVAI
jgi:hypothetical protein